MLRGAQMEQRSSESFSYNPGKARTATGRDMSAIEWKDGRRFWYSVVRILRFRSIAVFST